MRTIPSNLHVRIPKTAELVAHQLRRRIVRGELVEGDALPPEAQLMAEFGVSRPTLREAFRLLESEALISIHRGSRGGARVRTPEIGVAARYAALLLQYDGVGLRDVYDARLALEPAAARMLAERRSKRAALDRLDARLAEEHAALDDRAAHAVASTRFHQDLVEVAGNHTMAMLSGMLQDIIDRQIIQITSRDDPRPGTHGRINREKGTKAHAKLLVIVRTGDGRAAEDFWRVHMEAAGRLLFREMSGKTVVDLMG
ncbi:MAG: GntR family transcriptional regulator [Ilumatobacteraceae bacterium]